MVAGKRFLGRKELICSSGIVALIICGGAIGKQESAAWPTMTERSGDHSVSAETRGVGTLTMATDLCVLPEGLVLK